MQQIHKIKTSTDRLLFFQRQSMGSVFFITLYALVQTISISIFYASIFQQKVSPMVGELVSKNTLWVISIILGIGSALVIESGSFFFAINNLKKQSYASAIVAGVLSVASFYHFFSTEYSEYIRFVGIMVLAFYPSWFIMSTSHHLALKIDYENVDETVKQAYENYCNTEQQKKQQFATELSNNLQQTATKEVTELETIMQSIDNIIDKQ